MATRQTIDDRAIGAVITGAGLSQCRQTVTHRLEITNMLLDLRDFLQGTLLDLCAMAMLIVKQGHQLTALLQGKADLTRLAQ